MASSSEIDISVEGDGGRVCSAATVTITGTVLFGVYRVMGTSIALKNKFAGEWCIITAQIMNCLLQ